MPRPSPTPRRTRSALTPSHPGLLWVAVLGCIVALEQPTARGQDQGVEADLWAVRFADDIVSLIQNFL